MQIASGSEANCLRMEDFVKIQNGPDLKKTRATLKAYNGERVFPKGEVYLRRKCSQSWTLKMGFCK